ncbi:MAG: hypothetical protein CMN34_06080 [Saprospirales bacterium]|nr:hypothetical protein [Saprospirales bacterium]
MANTFTARDTLKTKLLAALGSATSADQIVKLSRTIEKANLDDDADLETALDTKVSAMADSASTEDIEKLAFGVKKLRTSATATDPVSSMIPEGSSNLYVTDSRVRGSFSASGDLSYDSGTGVLSYTALPDALTVYATVGDLPLPENTNVGAKGIVEENKKLYINSGSSWLNVGLVDQKPSFTTTPDGSYTLSPGADTVITLNATDPQGDPITFSHVVSAGSLGGSTVSQSGNVFTITGSSDSNDTAPFSITFRASDGTNITDATSEFTVGFAIDWSAFSSWNTTHIVNPNPGYSTWTDDNDGNKFGRTVAISENYFVVSSEEWFSPGYRGGKHYLYDMSGTLLHTLDFGAANYFTSNNGNITNGERKCLIHEGKGIVVVTSNRKNGGNNQTVLDIYSISTGNLLTSWFGLNSVTGGRAGDSIIMTEDGNTLLWSSYALNWSSSTSGGAYKVDMTDPSNPVLGSFISGNGKFSGRNMAVKNNWLLYSADGTSGQAGLTEPGRANLYNLSTQSTYQIDPPVQAHYGNFGLCVAITDTHLLISSPGNAGTDNVWVFDFDSTDDNASAPTVKGKISGGNHLPGYTNNFGQGIEVGDGAFFVTSNANDDTIWSYSFDALPTGGTANSDLSAAYLSSLTISNPNTDGGDTIDRFASNGNGSSRHNFAVHGTKIVAGAWSAQESGYNGSGAAYLFTATT